MRAMDNTAAQLAELRERLENGATRGIFFAGLSTFAICFAVTLLVTTNGTLVAPLLPLAMLAGLELARNMRLLVEIKGALRHLKLVETVADTLQKFQLATAQPEGRA
jgi:hypothetical protein